MNPYRPPYPNELYHHGIKGQKWGVRNGPPYPLSAQTHASVVRGSDKTGRIGGLKEASSTIKNNLTNLYANNYIDRGMDRKSAKKAAEAKAENTVKNMKRIAIGAGVALGAAAAYKGSRYLRTTFLDKNLKAGKNITTISPNPNRMTSGDSFYTAYRPQDIAMYKGHFSSDANHKIQAKVLNDTKIASHRNAKKVFDDLYKNDERFRFGTEAADAVAALGAGINPKMKNLNKYQKFNYGGFMENPTAGKSSQALEYSRKKYIDALKSKGYGGIRDLNDNRYSNFDTDAAILFTNPKNYSATVSKHTIKDAKRYRPFYYGRSVKNVLLEPGIAPMAAIGAGYSGMGIKNTLYDRKAIQNYKKKKRKKR